MARHYFSSFRNSLESYCPGVTRGNKNLEWTKISRAHLYRNEDKSDEGGKGIRVTGHAVKVLLKEKEGGYKVFPSLFSTLTTPMCVQPKRRVKNRRVVRRLAEIEKQICIYKVSRLTIEPRKFYLMTKPLYFVFYSFLIHHSDILKFYY